MNISIRDFKISDANSAFEIIKDCYENLEIGGHNAQGLKMQIDGNRPEKLIERTKSIKYIVAVGNDQIVGVGGYDSCKIHSLFITRELHGSGVGKMILKEILNRARKEGIKSLLTWSTFFAKNFYLKNGFEFVREINLPEDKQDIQLIEMRRLL
jgi:N-acetylglutamate synthase-like GNAT family acetyltransferase